MWNLWIRAISEKRPLYGDPTGGRYSEVLLYYENTSFIVVVGRIKRFLYCGPMLMASFWIYRSHKIAHTISYVQIYILDEFLRWCSLVKINKSVNNFDIQVLLSLTDLIDDIIMKMILYHHNRWYTSP